MVFVAKHLECLNSYKFISINKNRSTRIIPFSKISLGTQVSKKDATASTCSGAISAPKGKGGAGDSAAAYAAAAAALGPDAATALNPAGGTTPAATPRIAPMKPRIGVSTLIHDKNPAETPPAVARNPRYGLSEIRLNIFFLRKRGGGFHRHP